MNKKMWPIIADKFLLERLNERIYFRAREMCRVYVKTSLRNIMGLHDVENR